ncbi:hypothetical protein chiPu_0001158 [Chiloscyllium punctatum]|uniref:Uncharacterized protein n=1 Tax=Chiloscyllium punctatum TaxID=137246 RepID=A0A401RXE4_CHIPU|nr:hypothetical protein [Chiloscyllium punctatum]
MKFEGPPILKASLLDEGSRLHGAHDTSDHSGRKPGQLEAAYTSPMLGACWKMEGPERPVPERILNGLKNY